MHQSIQILAGCCLALGLALPAAGEGDAPAKAVQPVPTKPAVPVLEPAALELLKAMSGRLAAAESLTFDAVASYESPSRYGAPLVYKTLSQVSLARPDKLKVITAADGPPVEFYYDGKSMVTFSPDEDLVAAAEAPGTVDAMLAALYELAGTYFPFTDFLVSDPYADLAKDMTLAFVVGQSQVVDGITTDIVAFETGGVFLQVWIGAEDKLPRRARAVFFADPQRLRHEVELFHWKLDEALDADDFVSKKAASAKSADYAHPKLRQAPATATPPKADASRPAAPTDK